MSGEKNKLNDSKEKRPRVIVGAFIFNDKNELFLMKTVQWSNKYTVPGGGLEPGEELEEAVKREVKEETDMDIENLEFIGFTNAYDVNEKYKKAYNHLVFFDFIARVKGEPKIKLNKEGVGYKWFKIDDLIKKGDSIFPHKYLLKILEKIKSGEYNFEHKYKRALADYQNLVKQTAKEKQEFVKYINEQLLHEILPVYDNLKLALMHAKETPNNSNIIKGVGYVIKQFKDVLENLGVEEIETAGKKFDHNTMEAVEGKGDKVKQEVKPGYKLNGKVIAHAKVILE